VGREQIKNVKRARENADGPQVYEEGARVFLGQCKYMLVLCLIFLNFPFFEQIYTYLRNYRAMNLVQNA
jgi:hypothetical protein